MKQTSCLIGFVMVLVAASLAVYAITRKHITLESTSPSGEFSVVLEERRMPFTVDRNIYVVLRNEKTGEPKQILLTPDEARPPGTERILWSRDGNHFLLVGTKFYTKHDLTLETGEIAYLLYHIPTERVWHNSRQMSSSRELAPTTLDNIDFTEPLNIREPEDS